MAARICALNLCSQCHTWSTKYNPSLEWSVWQAGSSPTQRQKNTTSSVYCYLKTLGLVLSSNTADYDGSRETTNSKSVARKGVLVRVRPGAPIKSIRYTVGALKSAASVETCSHYVAAAGMVNARLGTTILI